MLSRGWYTACFQRVGSDVSRGTSVVLVPWITLTFLQKIGSASNHPCGHFHEFSGQAEFRIASTRNIAADGLEKVGNASDRQAGQVYKPSSQGYRGRGGVRSSMEAGRQAWERQFFCWNKDRRRSCARLKNLRKTRKCCGEIMTASQEAGNVPRGTSLEQRLDCPTAPGVISWLKSTIWAGDHQ